VNATSPDLQSRTDLGAVVDNLVKVLGDGGTIGKGLGELIKALNNF
jgi:hypothetical protein